MGIVYDGPYAEDVHRDGAHEGYAARLLPDGTLTGIRSGEHTETGHIGLVGACSCGWHSERTRPPGPDDSPAYQAALRDFETQHLDPLIKQARQSWPRWVSAVTGAARYVAELADRGELADADEQLNALRAEIDRQITLVGELHAEQHTPTPRQPTSPVLAFVPLTTTPHGAIRIRPAPPAPESGHGHGHGHGRRR